jgi:hypothetical protein
MAEPQGERGADLRTRLSLLRGVPHRDRGAWPDRSEVSAAIPCAVRRNEGHAHDSGRDRRSAGDMDALVGGSRRIPDLARIRGARRMVRGPRPRRDQGNLTSPIAEAAGTRR